MMCQNDLHNWDLLVHEGLISKCEGIIAINIFSRLTCVYIVNYICCMENKIQKSMNIWKCNVPVQAKLNVENILTIPHTMEMI